LVRLQVSFALGRTLSLELIRILRVASIVIAITAMAAGFLGAIYLWRAEWAPDARGRRRLQPLGWHGRVSRYLLDPNRLTSAGRPLYRRGMWLLACGAAGFGLAVLLMAFAD
jgi:hypothetical protein